jgi:hypothetical protein
MRWSSSDQWSVRCFGGRYFSGSSRSFYSTPEIFSRDLKFDSVLTPILPRHISTPVQIIPDLLLPLYLYLRLSVVHWIFSKMQRALTSRASTLGRSSTSKLRPVASAGFNAQQLRFAHKVCTHWTVSTDPGNFLGETDEKSRLTSMAWL